MYILGSVYMSGWTKFRRVIITEGRDQDKSSSQGAQTGGMKGELRKCWVMDSQVLIS